MSHVVDVPVATIVNPTRAWNAVRHVAAERSFTAHAEARVNEGYLLNPYGNPNDLVVDDVARGSHATRPDALAKGLVYEADLILRSVVPAFFVTNVLLDKAPPLFGPRLPSPEGAFHRHQLHSAAFGFAESVLTHVDVERHASGVNSLLQRVVVHPHGSENSRILVSAAPADDAVLVGGVIRFVRSLARRLDEVAQSGAVFADAWDALRARGLTGEPGEDRMREVKALVEEVTRFAHGTTERVGDGLETRLSVSHSGLELEGSLVARWCDATASEVDIVFQCALPPVDVAEANLRAPEPTGPLAFLKTWGEVEVGDRALDDAFLIEGEPRAAAAIVHARAELLALVPFSAHMSFTGTGLVARLFRVPARKDTLHPVVDALLEMWRRTALFRAGVRVSDDDA